MSTRMSTSVFVICCCITVLLGSAQETATIAGVVVDETGATIPGAAVTLSGPESRHTVSDERGAFQFAAVLPGRYVVTASLLGFVPSVSAVEVTAGVRIDVRATMAVAMLQETITVSATSPVIDAHTASTNQSWGRWASRERYRSWPEEPFRRVWSDALSTFSVDVDTAAYSNMRRFLAEGELPPVDAIRIEELVNYFTFDYPQPRGDAPFSVTLEVAPCPWNPNHLLGLVGLQGRRFADAALPPRNLVYLVDVSGSMDEPDKLPLVQTGLRLLTRTLRSQDRVAIVVYAGASGLVLPPTSGDDKARILAAIDGLRAGGSTNGGEGLALAYRTARAHFQAGAANRVILATDGDFNVGVADEGGLKRLIEQERESGIYLSVLGVGTENLQDATMEMLADHGNGNYAYLDSASEANRVLVRQAGATLVTIAKDVKVQVEFNPRTVEAYRLIGYENRRLHADDFEDDGKDAGEIGAGHAVTALYELVPARDLRGTMTDRLRYQLGPRASVAATDKELATISLRYKQPDGGRSRLVTTVMWNDPRRLGDNLGFASAVAEVGLLLRNSPFAGGATFDTALARARQFKGEDPDGYRAEFIRLGELAAQLAAGR